MNILQRLFGITVTEPTSTPVPPSRVAINWRTDVRVEGEQKLRIEMRGFQKCDPITWTVGCDDFCKNFREGRGYESIDGALRLMALSYDVSDAELAQIRDFLRAWGHLHADDRN